MAETLRSFEYLESLPGTVFQKLYQQPSTALAIFRRMLPHLAKTLVMATLFMSEPFPVANLDTWVKPESRVVKDQAISLLQRLHIVAVGSDPGKSRSFILTKSFANSLRRALTGGGHGGSSFGMPCRADHPGHEQVSIAELDEYARQRWEAILGYMVGSAGTEVNLENNRMEVSNQVKILLREGNLIVVRGRRPEITQDGFAFILQEVNAQVWSVLIYYLDLAEKMEMDQATILSFLFILGSLELGQSYSKVNMGRMQTSMLSNFADFGLVYQSRDDADCFYPTRLATTLLSDASALRQDPATATQSTQEKGYIILETNYRLYAYTSSPLQIAILKLFSRIRSRYPNMVAAKLTRESIRSAVAKGITSDQVVSYLNTHAHPVMRTNNPILPPTVVDQIRLWQIENERMKATTGFLFKEFLNSVDYESCAKYADELGVLVWRNDAKKMFFVTRYEQLQAFLVNRQQKKAGNNV